MMEGIKDKMRKALKQFEQDWCIPPEFAGVDYDALVKQAIVVECEVEHRTGLPGAGQAWEVMKTISYGDRRGLQHEIHYRGNRKFIGKAIAIVLPFREKPEELGDCMCGKVATRICSASGCIVALCNDCSCPHGS